jgi:hypothetical protein
MYFVTIAGNLKQCRTEAEISDESGSTLAIVFEDSAGWHTNVLDRKLVHVPGDLNKAIGNAKEALIHYVNRRGENAPENMTSGAFSLWLMVKDDGTAMGQDISAAE